MLLLGGSFSVYMHDSISLLASMMQAAEPLSF